MPRKKSTPEELLHHKWERLSRTHEKSFAAMRELTSIAIEGLLLEARSALEGQRAGEVIEIPVGEDGEVREVPVTVARAVDARSIGVLSKALRDAVAGEREAVSLDYLDSNRAVAKVVQLGFLVTREDGTIDVASEVID